MTVAGVTAAVLYTALGAAFRARAAATEEVDAVRVAAAVVETLRADWAGALPPTGVLAGAFTGENDDALGDRVTFVTNNPHAPAAEAMGELYGVELSLVDRTEFLRFAWLPDDVDDADAGRCLVRTVTTNLLASGEAETVQQLLADRVTGLQLRYFDGSDWADEWDSTVQDDTLPGAVEVTLTLLPAGVSAADDDVDDLSLTVRRVVGLPLAPSAAQRELEAAGG